MRIEPLCAAATVVLLCVCGCDEPDVTGPPELRATFSQAAFEANVLTVPTSLHATAAGMRYWYVRGFGALPGLAGVPYSGLSCGSCHVPSEAPASCAGCHGSQPPGPGTAEEALCLACHARQAAEIQMGLGDVHRAAGLRCWDCHAGAEMHGDGTSYASMFETNVPQNRCTGCHGPPSTRAHRVHGDRLACSACHMATAVTCVNCHFDKEVNDGVRVAAGRAAGWQFLGNYRNQVYPLNFQSLEYMGNTYVSFGPYHGHTITRAGRACEDCHASEHVVQLAAPGGQLKVLDWNGTALVPAQGVIPVPQGYENALRFDFASLSGTSRSFLGTGPDAWNMLFAEPLTPTQMSALARQRRTHVAPEGHPTCDGRPATIWVGMDPAQMPRGASITQRAGGSGYRIIGTRDNDVIVGSIEADSIWGLGGDDIICGLEGADVIHGGSGNDRLFGGPGADVLHGDDGDDFLVAGPGPDRLFGGRGDDVLVACQGTNTLSGGPGDDQFHGRGRNRYDDFSPARDVIFEESDLCASHEEDCGGGCGGDHDDGGCGDDHDDGGCGGGCSGVHGGVGT